MILIDQKKLAAAGDELERLLEFNSESGNEMGIINYLEERCREMRLKTQYQQVIGVRYNLVVNPMPEPDLIITVHVDTVPEKIGDVECRYDVEGERYYGRGAVDNKGGIAALVLAMEEYFKKNGTNETPPVTFVFTVDEEREGYGSEKMAQLGGHYAVVIEPTDLAVCTAQSGSVVLQARVHGKSAHGGEYESGENAIFKGIELLNKFNELPDLNQEHPMIGKSGYNLQYFSGGTQEMVVPFHCDMLLDFRVLPNQAPEQVQKAVDSVIEQFEGIDSKWVEVSGPFEIDPGEPVADVMCRSYLEALGKEARIHGFRSWADAENLFKYGIKPIIFGPGILAVAHTEEEYVDLSEVVKASRVFTSMIANSYQLRIKKQYKNIAGKK